MYPEVLELLKITYPEVLFVCIEALNGREEARMMLQASVLSINRDNDFFVDTGRPALELPTTRAGAKR
jgi:hypothetical protein